MDNYGFISWRCFEALFGFHAFRFRTVFLSFILHTLIQLLILCAITIAAVKKLGYEIRGLIVSILIMYLLFAVYSPSSKYLLVYTGGLNIAFGQPQPAMPSWAAAIFIILQYGVVMLITTLAAQKKHCD